MDGPDRGRDLRSAGARCAWLARVVGKNCNIDQIIDDIREELRSRPYELVSVAGGWRHRTRKAFGDVIRAATGEGDISRPLSQSETLVLTSRSDPRLARTRLHCLWSAKPHGPARPIPYIEFR